MIAGVIGVRVVQQSLLDWKPDMKFDVVVGNPPYQDKDYLLYPEFFKKALNIGAIVSFVMPANLQSQQVRLKKHNEYIRLHSIQISDDVSRYFPTVGVGEIRNIIASKSTENAVAQQEDVLLGYVPIYHTRRRLVPRRGKGEFSRLENQDENGIPCIVSIYRGDEIQWRKIKPAIVNKKKSTMQSTTGWFVLIQEHPSNGLFNTTVIQNNGIQWGSGVFALDAETEEDAKKLKEWLISPTIQKEVKKLLALKGGTHSISGPMVSLLPYYK
jgi:hypothetical protein